MAAKPAELVQGTLDMLILKTLALEPLHGYGIGLRIQQISRGVFQVNPGSLFPAFRRLERQGLVKADWRSTENNRRAKYYALTEAGRKKLRHETREWQTQRRRLPASSRLQRESCDAPAARPDGRLSRSVAKRES